MADGDSKVVDLQDLNPEFQRRLGNFLTSAKAAGIPAHIIEAYRDRSVQAQYYAEKQQGKRPYPVAPPGTSFHEGGFAADTLADDRSQQQKLIDYANQHPEFGIAPLPGDAPHFQIAGYRHLADALKNPPAYQGGAGAADLSPFIAANQGYSVAKGYTPYTPGTMVAGPGAGTTINAASAPVKGALAEQGPESAGSQPAYTFTLPKNAPMGMGNNNPLNIKYYKGAEKDYNGLTGPSDNTDQGDPQMKFSSPEAGWNAAYSLLNKKYTGGKTTPNMIIAGQGGWTPGNTQAAANVAKLAGIGPDDDIGFGDSDKAHKFMRALVTQEQGDEAAKAYPDEMIAASIGGNAPAAGSGTAAPASSGTAVAAAPADQGWLSKLISPPTDAEGKPIAGGKSPLQELSQASIAKLGSEGQTERQEAPAQSALSMQGPGARNVSPGLGNVAQIYGQTLNSFSTPLTWGHGAQGVPGMPMGGLRSAPALQAPGISLTSLPAAPGGLGYGIDPNLGYGFG